MSNKQSKIFILGGLTGGPLVPLLAISKKLKNVDPIILGVKNSFESKYCNDNNLDICYLPKAKLNLLSFKNQTFLEIVFGLLDLFSSFFKLAWSFVIATYLLFKYKPKLILSSGSFLSVPIFWSAKIWKTLGLINAKLILHQQDPEPGLANKLTIKIADYSTCAFEYTKNNYKSFKNSVLIPNPIDYTKFDSSNNSDGYNNLDIKNLELKKFLDKIDNNQINKPILLIFGGGSGASFINQWVWDNLDQLLENNFVIHLSGNQLDKSIRSNQDYLLLEALTSDMPVALVRANRVICRAGISTITELNYLDKKAFIVPIPGSHQELNARLASSKFSILEQKNADKWLNQINSLEYKPVTVFADKVKAEFMFRLNPDDIKLQLDNHYQILNNLIN